ncbi:MAG: ATPase [Propionibacteriaceae bacterium]|jgi:hypothetical protein|nr:ATPase [Propionibacteriaceae bacterium]
MSSTDAPDSSATDPTPSLARALADLERVGLAAGLDPTAVRAEGESFAAALAESAKGAPADWTEQTGRVGMQAFFDAASRGRRWRAAPTTLLSQLTAAGSAHAAPYAEALTGVSAAACRLGEPSMRVVGNASVASSAQLAAVRPAVASRPDETAVPAEAAAEDDRTNPLLGVLRLTQDHLADLARLGLGRSADEPIRRSSLDLTADDAGLPGAFPGLGSAGPPAAPPAPNSASVSAPADSSVAPAPSPAEEPEPEPPSLEELLAELNGLTGLSEVKAEIHRQVAVLRMEGLRSKAGLKSATITRHLVFVGNPGTGKTTVARLVGGIYRALGLLSRGQLVEVDRSELVAGYLGQTAIKTAEVVASAVGGVLFIDEAYSLAGDQYGTEAVDTLVKEMEDKRDDLVLIVAGYPDPMAIFVAQNPGLASRFRTTIEFADYTDAELVEIFTGLAARTDYDVVEDCLARFRTILASTPRGMSFGNGRFARNQLEAAIGRHAWRLRDIAEPTVQQLRELRAEDLDDVAVEQPPVDRQPQTQEDPS